MQGHNKAFMANPVQYLSRYTLTVRPPSNLQSPLRRLDLSDPAKVHQFDLRPNTWGSELIPFVPHPKTHRFGTQRPINAYFLDYRAEAVRVIPLGNDADYMFTPVMNGCYFGYGKGQATHVAGDYGRRDADKQEQAKTALGGAIALGFDSNPADADEFTIVGVRRPSGWTFYVQGHEMVYERFGRLQPCFDKGVGAGQILFEIKGLERG